MNKRPVVPIMIIIVGLITSFFISANLYKQKVNLSTEKIETRNIMFYAGMDKFLSNVSWMRFLQYRGEFLDRTLDDPKLAEAVFQKYSAVIDLDPLFYDAYLIGARDLAPSHPELALALIDKGIAMGIHKRNWEIPYCGAWVLKSYTKDLELAIEYLDKAIQAENCPLRAVRMKMHTQTEIWKDTPMRAMELWYNHFVERAERMIPFQSLSDRYHDGIVIDQIRYLGEIVFDDCNEKLKSSSDKAEREILVERKKEVREMLEKVGANRRVPLPPTTPVT